MRSKRKSRGSTVVEVLMAITILAIGASGIVSLQKVTVSSNRRSQSLIVANQVVQTWVERLRADAMLWNHPSSTNPNSDREADTTWLKNIQSPEPSDSAWFRPTTATITGIHDLFGMDDASKTGPYCVNLRLSWVRGDQNMIRAEVRVYWINRNEGDHALAQTDLPCGGSTSPPDVDSLAKEGIFHVVQATTAIVKNQAP